MVFDPLMISPFFERFHSRWWRASGKPYVVGFARTRPAVFHRIVAIKTFRARCRILPTYAYDFCMQSTVAARMQRSLLVLCVIAAGACRTYRPAPLAVRITSAPSGATAVLSCPTTPDVEPQTAKTPETFRIPMWASPCSVVVSKEGWVTREQTLQRDQLRARLDVRANTVEPRPTLQPGATPWSVLGLFIVRWLNNVGDTVSERVSTSITPDVTVHIVLEPEPSQP
jgi:hypothetical protein